MAWIRNHSHSVRPKVGEPIWVFDEYYSGVTVGMFDGRGFCTLATSDDCLVTHWAPMEYPSAPDFEEAGEVNV